MDPTATTLWSVTPPVDCVPDEVEWRTNRVIELGIRRAWMMVGVLGLTLGVLTGSAEASEGSTPSSRSFADAFFVSTRAMPDGQRSVRMARHRHHLAADCRQRSQSGGNPLFRLEHPIQHFDSPPKPRADLSIYGRRRISQSHQSCCGRPQLL